MKTSNWIKILLIASLAFNFAIVVTVLTKKFAPRNAGPINTPAPPPELHLQDDQKKEIRSIMKSFRIKLVKFKQDILEKRMDIIEELSDPECDFDQIKLKTRELNESENQMNNLFVDTLIRINNLLNPRQRLSLLLELSQNWFFLHGPDALPGHHPDMWERRKR